MMINQVAPSRERELKRIKLHRGRYGVFVAPSRERELKLVVHTISLWPKWSLPHGSVN